ncbi:DNA topoisomerase, partial [Xanthomonas euvesicatoria]|uniref:DNA topoisomerase n=1 Tax=Xanthomonas euvesicatoria TaxID=456327 RepID=UPI0023AA1C22
IDMDLVHAQEGRRALDRFVGYMVSPLLSDMLGMSLSAGRVQSVAVRLVVELERRIAAFKSTKHFGAVVMFDAGGGAKMVGAVGHEAVCDRGQPVCAGRGAGSEGIAVAAIRGPGGQDGREVGTAAVATFDARHAARS